MGRARLALFVVLSLALHGLAVAVVVSLRAPAPARPAEPPRLPVEVGLTYGAPGGGPGAGGPSPRPDEPQPRPAPARPARVARPDAKVVRPAAPAKTAPLESQDRALAQAAEAMAAALAAPSPDSGPATALAERPAPTWGTDAAGSGGTDGGAGGAGAGLGGGVGLDTGSGRGQGSGVGSGTGGGAGSGRDDALALAEIARRLSASASRCYPRAALRLRAEGVAKVRFCVGGSGEAVNVSLVEGSGVGLLDDAAVGCVLEKAAPFPAVEGCLAVPVTFRIAR